MEILHQEDEKGGAFFIEKEGRRLAEMTYVRAGSDKIIIDHTEVSDELRGTGAGKKLVHAGVEWAREQGILIKPLCPFAKRIMEMTEAYHDVLLK